MSREKTWTGFANSEEKFADESVGRRRQPFWIEEEAKEIPNTNFIVNGRFKSHAVRDGNLITGQQQHSGAAAARLLIEARGFRPGATPRFCGQITVPGCVKNELPI